MTSISPRLRSGADSVLVRACLRVLGLAWPRAAARMGVELFCSPGRHHGGTHAALQATAGLATCTRLRAGDRELATWVWGNTQTCPYVLLAHGASGHALQFHRWVCVLRAAGYAVVAFDAHAGGTRCADLPGFAEGLLAIGRHHGRAAAAIGHALGGSAVALALSGGLDADCAVLVAPAADPDAAILRFARRLGVTAAVHRRMAALLERRIGAPLHALQAHCVTPAIGRPALVVHDLQDEEVPWDEGERYARHWPDSRLFTTRGLGHHGILDSHEVIASCLRFLRGETVGERVVSSPNLPFGVG